MKNERAINKSVRNIVETNPGEKFFQPLFGAEVRNQLFELVDFGNASIIEEQIGEAIDNFEPRVILQEIDVEPRPDTNEFEVTIIYEIVGQAIPAQQYTFILQATR